MSRRLGILRGVFASLACGMLVIAACSFAPAAEPELDARLAAHLRAGEFGPAQAAAVAMPEGPQRDQMLRQIAMAQAAAGARRGALGTIGSMGDDRLRSGAIDQLGSQPLAVPRGGAAMADFTELLTLITTTVDPESWELLGGPGAVAPFTGGVYVDTAGTLKKMAFANAGGDLAELRRIAGTERSNNRDARQSSNLRKVSLTRLEKQVQLLWAQGRSPDEAMRTLAGLQKVQYVFIYPETGDIVLAGPAGDWQPGPEGRLVNVDSGRPVLHLDDLVVVLRNAYDSEGQFGCSIIPTQEALARTQQFLDSSAQQPIRPTQRSTWLEELRSQVGQQDIEIYGIDPRSRAARLIVEADYRMKLIGMGLEEGTAGVTSYLDAVRLVNGAPPAMDVLRWWFTLNYDAVKTTEAGDAYAVEGPGVKVLSENELLSEQGERIHTGKSDELNSAFARSFTQHFEQLAAKYPIYAELQNIFDLALVAAIIKSEDLAGRVDWHMMHFGNPEKYQIELGIAPSKVDTVINHRIVDRKHVIAGVSGGVAVDASRWIKTPDAVQPDSYGLLKVERQNSVPAQLEADDWWWD